MDHFTESRPVLKRKKINQQLVHLFDYPLTLVVAAMGYGKSVAVRDFLEEQQAEYVWMNVERDETSAHSIWDSITRQFAESVPDVGETLHAMGFPTSAADIDRMIDLLEEWTFLQKKVLVIDDYHFANTSELDLVLENIVRRKIAGLNVLILSRTRPGMSVQELIMKGYCYQLKSSFFELSISEIKEYFLLYDLNISDDMAVQVQEMTEGWVAAVYLVCRNYREKGNLETGVDIHELIQTTILKRYSENEMSLLMDLSILDSFTLQQAVYISQDHATAGMIQKLSRDNSFFRFDERTQKYVMHNIFSGYLRMLLEEKAGREELLDLYKRCGDWYLSQGLMLPGIALLLRAEAYDSILQEFEKPNITSKLSRLPAQEVVRLFEQIPQEAKYKHPIGYITYADFYLSRVDMAQGAQLLAEIEAYYQNHITPPSLKRRIEGEIQLVKIFLNFNDLRKMVAGYKKAYLLLDGRSRIANPDMIFTLGCPTSLHLYHREKGDLLNMVKYAESNYHYYEELSGGCGKGYENLIRAEYSLEICELELAELHAYKAIYKAETLEQASVIIDASFTLARLAAARGKFQEAKDLLNELTIRITEYKSPILMNTLDLCYGYLGGITGDSGSFANWIRSGNMKKEEMFYQGLTFHYLVHAKYLLLERNYLKIEVLCEEMSRLFPNFNNLLGYLHAYVLDAVAKYHLYGLTRAKDSLKHALEIGRADGVILPFAEYGHHILEILNELARENTGDPYLARLIPVVSQYNHNLERIEKEKGTGGQLTVREKEILKLLAEGFHNKEIAHRLFIAEITVKKTITSIYRKLGVSSRAGAVRKTMDLKII